MIEDDVSVSIPDLMGGEPYFRGTRVTRAVVDAELATATLVRAPATRRA